MPHPDHTSLTRRKLLGAGLAWGGLCAASRLGVAAPTTDTSKIEPPLSSADLAIDETTALLYSMQSSQTPAEGLRDARAVWSRVLPHPDKSVLLYFHGNNNFVTVDSKGLTRAPDWATTEAARAGATAPGKLAAALNYNFDKLDTLHRPVILVPEVGALAKTSFWANEPAGQFKDPARLGLLIDDCLTHLAFLKRAGGKTYLKPKQAKAKPNRIYLAGHSGAGLPMQEAATSWAILPQSGSPADLWLFDCTYWSNVAGFVSFCKQWHEAGRLGSGKNEARFVCVYKPGTQTEEIANSLRTEIATILGVAPETLLQLHVKDNFETQIRPVLQKSGVTFIGTDLPHDHIPTFFTPALLDSAAS